MTRTRIKICGFTRMDDIHHAVAAGVDAIGLVFAKSPRQVSLETAQLLMLSTRPMITTVGVFADQPEHEILEVVVELGLGAVQLHGSESPEFQSRLCETLPRGIYVIRRVRILDGDTPDSLAERVSTDAIGSQDILFDPGAGSGRTFDWSIARGFGTATVSGGLTPENVGDAIERARPYAVDVSSGVEKRPGVKDWDRMRAFVRAVRDADRRIALAGDDPLPA